MGPLTMRPRLRAIRVRLRVASTAPPALVRPIPIEEPCRDDMLVDIQGDFR